MQESLDREQHGLVLVVDDSYFARSMIVRELREMGIAADRIEQTDNGADALQRIASRQFDLYVLDIVMAEIDGIAVLKEVRASQPSAKVVMCSSSSSAEMIKEVIAIGIDGFLVKPFKTDDFRKTMKRCIPFPAAPEDPGGLRLTAHCHVCDSEMLEVNLPDTLTFYCPRNCMQIGPLLNALVNQAELDEDYERAKERRMAE